MTDAVHLPRSLLSTTAVDFGEATVAFETGGQLASVGELAIAGVGEGITEPYFTHTEDAGESAPTGFEALEADGIVVDVPAGIQMWAHVKATVADVDVGTGAEEAVDLVDFVALVNGIIVERSAEGPQDAAETVVGTFTIDAVIPVEEGDVIQFAYVASQADGVDEEFTVTTEAAEAQVIIAPHS